VIDPGTTAEFKPELTAMMTGRQAYEDLIWKQYILPQLAQGPKPGTPEYDDFYLRQEVRRNKRVQIENADAIGKSVARETRNNDRLRRWYG